MHMHLSLKKGLLILAAFLAVSLSGCANLFYRQPTLQPGVSTETPAALTSTPMPTFTPTLPPLGSEANPIVMAVIANPPTPEQLAELDVVAAALANHLQLSVASRVYSDYVSLELALQRGEAHLAWLQPVEYLLATQKNLLSAFLITNHLGVTAYGVQFVAHRDSNFIPYYNAGTNTSTADANVALLQFAGLRPCLTDDNSLAGYWVPLGMLAQNGVAWQEPVKTFAYSANLRALYIKGVCDFTSTYATLADPRTSSAVITDLQDSIDKLPIIWLSPPIIPNLSLSSTPLIDLSTQTKISEFLRDLSRTEEGKARLSLALQYEVSALEPQTDNIYNPLRLVLQAANLRLADLVTNRVP